MKEFGPFSPEELKECQRAWKEKSIKDNLTGDIEKDIEKIKNINKAWEPIIR